MEAKKVLICDKKWYDENRILIEEIDFDDILCIDFKNNFSYIILNEISNRKDDIICIVGKGYEDELKRVDEIIKFTYNKHNSCVVACKGMDDFDFSKFGAHDTVVCFPSNIFDDRPDKKVFSTVMELQKYFIFTSFDSRKFYLYLLNDSNNFKKIETDEDKRTKNVRHKKPSKEVTEAKPNDADSTKQISKEVTEVKPNDADLTRQTNKKPKKKITKAKPKDTESTKQTRIKPNKKVTKTKPKDAGPPKQTNEKPKILFVCDVKGWAWWIKSQYIKKHLKPFYDIDIINVIGEGSKSIDYKKYDIYFTYGYSYVSKINRADYNRRVAGVTAHRPIDALKSKLNKVKWTHANSLLLYNEISETFPNTFYIPNGVDTNLFYPQSDIAKDGKITFGHVGKISPRKGQKEYIEPAINKAGVKYFSHYNNYKNKIAHTDMPKIHDKYDVFICSSYEDGTPGPALEAAACGKPIISNKIGNMPELIENYKTGILLDSKKVDNYVDAIKWCKNNPDKVKEMGENIRRKIETEWTWELMARNYLYLFDKILGIDRGLSYYENPAFYHGIK